MNPLTSVVFLNATSNDYWISQVSVGYSVYGGWVSVKKNYIYLAVYGGSIITKYDKNGNLITTFYSSDAGPFLGTMSVDDDENIYFETFGSYNVPFRSFKINSSGTFQWGRQLTGYTGGGGRMGLIYNDGYYVSLGVNPNSQVGNARNLLVKRNSSDGSLQWQKETPLTDVFGGITINRSNGNLLYASGTNLYILDTSGNLLSSYSLTGASIRSFRIDSDLSGNIYLSTSIPAPNSTTDLIIIKLNSSMSILWQKTINTSLVSKIIARDSIKVDGSGNIYIGMATLDRSASNIYETSIIKLDSSGSVLWERELSSNGNVYLLTGDIDNDGTFYLGGQYNNSQIVLFKVPPDGSGTGTYGNYTYSTISYTYTTPSITISSSSASFGSPLTDGSASATISTLSGSQTKYSLL